MAQTLPAVLSIALSSVLVGYLVLLLPLTGRKRYRLLEQRLADDATLREVAYRQGMARQWALAVLALLLLALAGVSPAQAGVTLHVHGLRPLVPGLVGLLIGGVVVALLLRGSPARAGRLLQPVAALLPRTRRERRFFVGVALTAGVAEEVLYRGFLLDYLVHRPGALALTPALVLAGLAFGVAHAYQGLLGMVMTGLAGYALAALYVTTGSLLLPVVVHALVDLRILLVLTRGAASEPLAAAG